jgi:hypothetical protein
MYAAPQAGEDIVRPAWRHAEAGRNDQSPGIAGSNNSWTINFTVNKVDVTAMGDANLIWVAGLPDANGDFTGFYDTATAQTYVAATDGLPRNFYLYPSTIGVQGSAPGQYFFGTILPDYSVTGGVGAAVSLKSTWNAASLIARYPASGIAGT